MRERVINNVEVIHGKQWSHSVLGVRWPFKISNKACTRSVSLSHLGWSLGTFVGICLVMCLSYLPTHAST